ncbi:MAG: nucleoside recognition protein [Deltaproteobacteria bacterium]|nr:nucleoside recognition protein [Deltaproteobacteria bacterium]
MMPLVSAFKYLAVMVPSMILGVILVNLLTNLNLLDRLTWAVRPITRFGNLRDECGLSFITAFGSPSAANAMLVDLYQRGEVGKKELFVASITNSFPAILMHWRSMLPVFVPLLGLTGLAYFGTLVLIGFLKTGLVLTVGRILLPKRAYRNLSKKNITRPAFAPALRESLSQSKSIMRRIVLITIPVTVATFYLIDLGAFDKLTEYLAGIVKYLPIPAEGVAIIGAQFANSVAAYTVASNLLVKGILTGYEIIVVLLVGNILTSIVSLRYLIPYYMGIFGPRLGAELMIISMAIRQGLLVLTVVVMVMVW